MKKAPAKDCKVIIGMEPQFRNKAKPALLRKAALAAIRAAFPGGHKEKFELSLFVTDEPGIATLNKKYRNKDNPTDVLSFSFTDKRKPGDTSFISPGPGIFLGEVVLCYPCIRSLSQHEHQPVSRALALTTVHGVLHLLGRKHYRVGEKKIMQSEEQAALAALNFDKQKER